MRHHYRVYGQINLTSLSPVKEVNNILDGFGMKEKLSVWSDYHYDLSAARKLTDEEMTALGDVELFRVDSVEYLGMREDEPADADSQVYP